MTKVTELKNMMLDTWDGQIWYPRFYDIDTILSYDNSGEIKFDVDIEMEQGYWNTSSSRLWTKIRDLMHDELVEVYKDMRANGVTYENIMHYMYDEQIAKIPQTYYNMDYDIKYAPYADEYLGKAHGDGYQHMKRWLKKRFIFCDTLYDYAPSYNNDVLTIRANTLNEMNLTIETYTPLYQHVSFYNGNMEKIKITPGQPVTFKGFAQTETDQEVLIYGGSNIKKITGIQSMNPNSMLIGGATRLTELDISNCPILTIVNSNKANFSPHTYLNKLNMSNCPQLGGNLNVSNSPLLQEIKARNSAITGLLLPTSLRNLKTLELPNTISSLALYDASSLDTLKFDEGVVMQSIELSNCTGITNTENFDLTKTPTVILDNSYNTDELYMSETTNLTLRNMSNLERVIYTPNEEYSEFDINNVINGKNYKVTTSSCPKLKTFMTTAPHRDSYNNSDVEYEEKVILVPKVFELLDGTYTMGGYWANDGAYTTATDMPHYTAIIPSDIDITSVHIKTKGITNGQHVRVTFFKDDTFLSRLLITSDGNEIDQDIDVLTNCNKIIFVCDSNSNYMSSCTYAILSEDAVTETIIIKKYGDITPNTVFTANTLDLSATQFTDIKLLCTTDVYNLKVPTTMKNFYCDSAMDIDTDVIEDASYEVIHGELIEPYTTNYESEVVRKIDKETIYAQTGTNTNTDFIRVVPGSTLSIKRTSGEYGYNVYVTQYAEDKTTVTVGRKGAMDNYSVVLGNNTTYVKLELYTPLCSYVVTTQEFVTPNIIPSSANGSLIFNMYSNNTTQPTSTSPYMWDLTGLKLNDFYTYGMNNWIKPSDDSYERRVTSVKKISRWSVGGSLGGSGAGSVDYIALTPMIFKEGVTTVNFKSDKKICISTQWNDTTRSGQSTWATEVSQQFNADQLKYRNVHLFFMEGEGSYIDITTNLGDSYKIVMNELEDIRTDILTSDEVYAMSSLIEGEKILTEIKSITMPQRIPGYSVRLVNADITPNEYPTMLYPKWIDTGLPITGKLDYTKYNGTSLAWAYAYTTGDVDISPLDSRSQGNITQDYNKLYGTDFVDLVDVWVYKDTDVSKLSTNEAITKAYIEIDNDNQGSRIDEALAYYPNCTDLYLFDNNTATHLGSLASNTTSRGKIVNITLMDGHFENVTAMAWGIANFTALKSFNRIPPKVTDMNSAFYKCSALTIAPIIPNSVTNMQQCFRQCASLTTVPNIGNSVTKLENTFTDCTSLTTAPIIPNSVTNMNSTFYGCSSLTQAPVIPQGVTNMQSTFQGCTSLTTAPNIPLSTKGYSLDSLLRDCPLITSVAIPLEVLTYSYWQLLYGCTGLTNIDWIGVATTSLNVNSLKGNDVRVVFAQADIQELVPEHLADLTALGTTATLTLGETYLSYLTEDEIAQAVAKGWTLQ